MPQYRLTVPAPPAHYCDRPELTRRCAPSNRSLTLLMAPGGFGKTTLLATACRRASAQGVPMAWLTLAANDNVAAIDAYLTHAFQAAGIERLEAPRPDGTGLGQACSRAALLLGVLETSGRSFALALDEIDNASNPVVGFLNELIRSASPYLHMVIACRELPLGLDASRAVLGGDAEVITAEDLRFSRADIARFFDLKLSRRELDAIATETSGWPIALGVRGQAVRSGTGMAHGGVMDTWIGDRFWHGFAAADRECVLDAGLLDSFNAVLLEEVVERPGVFGHLATLPRLAGLLEHVGNGTRGAYRLHPLLRRHCAERRRNETPDRYRRIHRRVAAALSRRGETVQAMRHATRAEDSALAGEILVVAGGAQIWLLEGTTQLATANQLVSGEVTADPRLATTRCIALMIGGRLHDARRTYEAMIAHPVDPVDRIDRMLLTGAMAVNGCRPLDDIEGRAYAAEAVRVVALPSTGDTVRAGLSYGLSVCCAHRAEFNESLSLAREARRLAIGRNAYLTMITDAQIGEVAMARGRVRKASEHYRSAQLIASRSFPEDPRLCAYVEPLSRELALERNRLAEDTDPWSIANEDYRGDAPLSHYAATVTVAAELSLEASGPDAALNAIETLSERAHAAGLVALDGHLAALRVSVLAGAGRVAEAERAWSGAELPSTDQGYLAIGRHGWRTTEAIACARVRLFTASGDIEGAMRLERALAHASADRGLRRTLMRALALRVGLCDAAGDGDTALSATADYLAHYVETDYARPLLCIGSAAWKALERLADRDPDTPLARVGEKLLAMGRDRVAATPRLTGKEKAVLRRLGTESDKQVASALGLTTHGVRYHIRNIFRKLDARDRSEAVRRAHALGLLPHGARR